MTTDVMRQKLHDYIDVAENKKVEAIFTILEDEIEHNPEWWNDEEFVAELDRRSAELESGEVEGVDWEVARERIERH